MNENMSLEELEIIFSNPDKVMAVINKVCEGVNIPSPHDAYSYFLTGHCNIMAEILDNVFKSSLEFYLSKKEEHVIVKISGHFYDVRGYIDYLDLSSYELIDKEYFYYLVDTNQFGNYDKNVDKYMITSGTELGVEELNRVIRLSKNKKGPTI